MYANGGDDVDEYGDEYLEDYRPNGGGGSDWTLFDPDRNGQPVDTRPPRDGYNGGGGGGSGGTQPALPPDGELTTPIPGGAPTSGGAPPPTQAGAAELPLTGLTVSAIALFALMQLRGSEV